ncbi:MAG TPA: HAD-IA family hydrolase [Candidatus Limiplasma sp.]|nr:HAD-IA family hydrolase [Candidatus Limiplasma sp.]
MFRYDAVLFDMDGTLLDTLDDLTAALNAALAEHGFPAHSKETVMGFIGNGAYRLIQNALPAHTGDAVCAKVLATFKQHYAQHCDRLTRPYPGILSMLSALDEAGLKLAIISNKPDPQVQLLSKAFFGSLIHTAMGNRDDIPRKPAPDMLHLAMQALAVDPERTLYIGDSHVDFETAENAGIDIILASWGYENPKALRRLSPLFFVGDPAELPMLILQEQEDTP